MVNRLLGPDGEPISSQEEPQLVSARLSTRSALEHEPRDILIEIELLVPSLQLMQKAVARINDLMLAMQGHVTVRAPVMKIRYFVDEDRFDQGISWGNQIATVGGGGVRTIMKPLPKEKPAEDSGADPESPPPAG